MAIDFFELPVVYHEVLERIPMLHGLYSDVNLSSLPFKRTSNIVSLCFCRRLLSEVNDGHTMHSFTSAWRHQDDIALLNQVHAATSTPNPTTRTSMRPHLLTLKPAQSYQALSAKSGTATPEADCRAACMCTTWLAK